MTLEVAYDIPEARTSACFKYADMNFTLPMRQGLYFLYHGAFVRTI
jgi:hypothetical protein